MDEKTKRTKYIRAIERFLVKSLPTLKNPALTQEEFKARIASSYKFMKEIEPVRLDSSYLKQLEAIIERILYACGGDIEDVNNLQNSLMKDYNLAQKEKNRLTYKKEKYKDKSFNDGY